MAERSKPPSVRPGIRLSVHVPAGLPCGRSAWRGLAPVRIRRSIRSPPSSLGGLAPRCFVRPVAVLRRVRTLAAGSRAVPARFGAHDAPRAARAEAVAMPPPAPHRSGGGVSLLFQRRRSPVPGFPRSPARRWGDFPRVRTRWHVRACRYAAVAGLSLPVRSRPAVVKSGSLVTRSRPPRRPHGRGRSLRRDRTPERVRRRGAAVRAAVRPRFRCR